MKVGGVTALRSPDKVHHCHTSEMKTHAAGVEWPDRFVLGSLRFLFTLVNQSPCDGHQSIAADLHLSNLTLIFWANISNTDSSKSDLPSDSNTEIFHLLEHEQGLYEPNLFTVVL